MKNLGQEVAEFHKDDGLVEVCVIEELSELIKAVTKHQRGKGNMENTIEEVAHVLLLCNALITHYGIDEQAIYIEADKAVQKMHKSKIEEPSKIKWWEV